MSRQTAAPLPDSSLWCSPSANSKQRSEYYTRADGKSIVHLNVCVCVCAHQCGCLTEGADNWAINSPYNQHTISHPYTTRRNNTPNSAVVWGFQAAAVITSNLTNSAGLVWRRPDCSKAFIWRQSGGNNGIIVVDGGCLSHSYLHRLG